MDSSVWGIMLGLASVIFFVLLNGFFVAAEFGLVSVRPTRIEELAEQGNRSAVVVRRAIADPDSFIAATQLGITLASLSLGWIGEPALARLIVPLLEFIPSSWANAAAHSIAVTVAFIVITFLHVVVGELAPKSIALQHPERTALYVARPTEIALHVFRPAIWALNGAGNALLRLVGIQPASGHERVHSVQELMMLIQASQEEGVLHAQEQQMIQAVFDLRALRASQVMVPRTDMVCVPGEATLRELAELAAQTSLTKFPVFEDDLDHIVGVVHVKDMVRRMLGQESELTARSLMREGLFLPETISVGDLLSGFRRARQHIAILVDEYGGTAGLVTLEDLLEEIVGDVQDVFDHVEPFIQRLADGAGLINGLAHIEDVNEAFKLSLQDPHYMTIGGLVMGRLDHVPAEGDELVIKEEGICLRVEKMDGLRVARLRLIRLASPATLDVFSKGQGA
ncbi:MAG: HlyC/CorC family transporter [Anaerolineae bacterium]|nr:HlyC/CorC family transporter [Anaerolineae bacterium]